MVYQTQPRHLGRFKCYLHADRENSIRQNLRSQSATAFQCRLSTAGERAIHPVTRPAFFDAGKPDSLNLEFFSDQVIEPQAACNDVSSEHFRSLVPNGELPAEIFVNLLLEKGYLAFVIILVVEIAIPLDSPPSEAANS